jgi:hypothetical protein
MKIDTVIIENQMKNGSQNPGRDKSVCQSFLPGCNPKDFIAVFKGDKGEYQKRKLYQPFKRMIQLEINGIEIINGKPVQNGQNQNCDIADNKFQQSGQGWLQLGIIRLSPVITKGS